MVVNDVLFEVVLGEVVGYIGLNGVGKMMSMWILVILEILIVGDVFVDGFLVINDFD